MVRGRKVLKKEVSISGGRSIGMSFCNIEMDRGAGAEKATYL